MSSTRNIDGIVYNIYSKDLSLEEFYKLFTRNNSDFNLDIHAITQRTGVTMLHAACTKGNAAITKVLLEMGANPNQQCNNRVTGLMMAMEAGHLECVKLLVEHGVRFDHAIDNYDKRSYLFYALSLCRNKEISDYVTSKLEELGLQLPRDLETVSTGEQEEKFIKAIEAHDLVAAKDIYDHYFIDVNLVGPFDSGLYRCLLPAITKGELDTVKFLVERGSYVTAHGAPYLDKLLAEIAREHGHEEVAVYLESVQRTRIETLKAACKPAYTPALFSADAANTSVATQRSTSKPSL